MAQSRDCPNDMLPTNGRRASTPPRGRPAAGRGSPVCPGGSWPWASRCPLLSPRGEAEMTTHKPAAAVRTGSAGQRVLQGNTPPERGRQQRRTPSGTGRHGRGLLSRPHGLSPRHTSRTEGAPSGTSHPRCSFCETCRVRPPCPWEARERVKRAGGGGRGRDPGASAGRQGRAEPSVPHTPSRSPRRLEGQARGQKAQGRGPGQEGTHP